MGITYDIFKYVYVLLRFLNDEAQQLAARESARTTKKLYDRRSDRVTLDEVERIALQRAARGACKFTTFPCLFGFMELYIEILGS
jgi:hypothetical protein